ncbi:MAG: hypothetical protein IKP88_16440 [Lachnospiraceae bacterium]|nr:hypothetical protein [Lachnospiraceae bacterium]
MAKKYHKVLMLCLVTIVFCGFFTTACISQSSRKPTDQELVAEVEKRTLGERIQYNGNGEFISLDRNLSFTAEFKGGEDSVFHEYSYQLTSLPGKDDYAGAVMRYWDPEIEKIIQKHGFNEYKIGNATPVNERGRYFAIFIDEDVYSEALSEVNSFIADLKEISAKEDKFHTTPYKMDFTIKIYTAIPGEDKCIYPRDYSKKIDHTMSDSDCKVENWNPNKMEKTSHEWDISNEVWDYDVYIRIR